MNEELAAGAWLVIAEGREAGTAGIFRPTGEVREGLINEMVHGVESSRIMFDAPQKHQQVWFIRRFGPDVNLGNIAAVDVLSLETLRLGLRSDTLGRVTGG
jgi:phosphosulfolactate synthase